MNKVFLPILAVIIVIAGAFLIANYETPPPPPAPVPPPDKTQLNTGFHGKNLETFSYAPGDNIKTEDGREFFSYDDPYGRVIDITAFYKEYGEVQNFDPRELSITKGTTVFFRNNDNKDHWPASAIHPTHQVYFNSDIKKCGTSEASKIFDACRGIKPGEYWAFTFGSTGVWNYHDHLNANWSGRIFVNDDFGGGISSDEALKIARKNGFDAPDLKVVFRDESQIFLGSCQLSKGMSLDRIKGTVLSFGDDSFCSGGNREDLGKLNVWKQPEVQELVKKHGAHVMIKALDIDLIEDIEYVKKIHPKFKEETGCIIVAYVHGKDGEGQGYVYQEDKELNIIHSETLKEFQEKTKKSDAGVMAKFYLSLH